MGYGPYENIKLRLTERDQLMKAVHKLMAAGISEDLIPTHLVRAFYVDMDELTGGRDLVADRLRLADGQPGALIEVGQPRHPIPGQDPTDRRSGNV